ncbi:MAG: Nif3-like dinuclear metal center hexameric protein [Clostridia bacterium]|nr:Nif3-like dinuclear metal center hexameric protein [Clostridia bacterium]
MITVKNISDYIDSIAPYSSKCEWDNCGVLVGDKDKEVKKIGFALDLTSEVLDNAKENNVDLLITHHPIIFRPVKSFLKGNLAYELAVSGITAISAHTSFDCAKGGVNDVLCDLLGITNTEGVPDEECPVPMARIGEIEPMRSSDFAKKVADVLGTACRVADGENLIKKVAVCGGSGPDDLLFSAASMGADAVVTGEIKYHIFLAAKEMGVTAIQAGHFETENPAVSALMKYINNEFNDVECVLLKQTNPTKIIG